MALSEAFHEILASPTMLGRCMGMIICLGLLCVAFSFGILLGWAWKPRWADLKKIKLMCSVSKSVDVSLPPSPLSSATSPLKGIGSAHCLNSLKFGATADDSCGAGGKQPSSLAPTEDNDRRSSQLNAQSMNGVCEEDLAHLCHLVEIKDEGPPWTQMMDRSTQTMTYQAWRRDPKTGPPQYRSRTVFEDATPEIVRDFFWDDKFRSQWDDMLAYSSIIEESPTTGTMIVHWIRKFPFFCSDREYIIGRRIWNAGRLYYCVTKGVPCDSVPKHDKPRRVDLYYSSWCIRAVESRRGSGCKTACEVLLFHHEDMGLPREVAKLGVRQGMWGAVKKIEPGLRAYQRVRASGAPLSRPAIMAQINTKISLEYLRSLTDGSLEMSGSLEMEVAESSEKPSGGTLPKILVFGGAIILACSLDQGILPKALIFSLVRRFAKVGKRY